MMRLFRDNDRSTTALKIVLVIGLGVLSARLLIWTDTFHSGLLYIAWPFGLSLALYYLTPSAGGTDWKNKFWNVFRASMIVLFGSALFLMEGYVCVVMFMPMFFLGFLLAFLAGWAYNRPGKNRVNAHIIPALVLLLSLEGVTGATTFERYNEVTHSQVVRADIQTIRDNLARPPEPTGKRHWILAIFPMPRTIGAVRIEQGAVRTYEFAYHRWFAANTHEGTIRVRFAEVDDRRIRTEIEDTSYISGYLKLHGTELLLEPVGDGETRVTLKIGFDRMIDPVWYFQPLERFAVKKSAEYFIAALLAKPA